MTESTITTSVAAFGFSHTYSLVPGPVTVDALHQGARRGVRAVVTARLGCHRAWILCALLRAGIALVAPHPEAAWRHALSAIAVEQTIQAAVEQAPAGTIIVLPAAVQREAAVVKAA